MILELPSYENLFSGKDVVITGGTGSFGNYIVRELLKFDVDAVSVFSRDEEKQLEMRRAFPDKRLRFFIGDVRDKERVIECVRGDFVYHAAALKIIPTCESNPSEAYKTNVLGSINVREACKVNEVQKALFISTDKAVKPVNTYGMTKALAEKIWASEAEGPCFSIVRYGNVLGSRGSIVPYFKELVSRGRPLPITHPMMSRFHLTLKQAIELVFYSTLNSTNGETLIHQSPASKITELAKALAGEDYPIEIVGVRVGEKIAETLISEEEVRRTQTKDGYYIVRGHNFRGSGELDREFTSDTAKQLGIEELKHLLRETNLL